MFALIESCPEQRPSGDWPTRMASMALHVLLTAAAVAATKGVMRQADGPTVIESPVFWPDGPKAQPPVSHPPLPGSPALPGTPAVYDAVPPNPWTTSSTLPPPDVPLTPFNDTPGPSLPGVTLDPSPGGPIGLGAVVDVRVVEQRPEMLSHPRLEYPEVLRQAGIEGTVLVEVVLDTLGRAEPASVRVMSSAHPLFDREALAVVAGSRYRPGRVSGRAVRVRIRVPVAFELRR